MPQFATIPSKGKPKVTADPAPPPPGWVRLRSWSLPGVATTWELNGPVVPAGYGGHDVTGRPQRVGLTSYVGRNPLTLKIPMLLDRDSTDTSIEPDITVLERLMGVRPGHPDAKPLRIVVEGVGIPHAYDRRPNIRWVLTGDPEWGDERFTRNGRGTRSYLEVAVTALQVSRPDPDAIDELEPEQRRVITVKRGSPRNTIREIAKANDLGWRALLELNPRLPRDPDKKLKPKTRIRLG